MFHYEILASLKEYNFVPWIGEQTYTEMLFWKFSNIIIYVNIAGKIPDKHLNVWYSQVQGTRSKKDGEKREKPVLLKRIWTLSHGLEKKHTLKC